MGLQFKLTGNSIAIDTGDVFEEGCRECFSFKKPIIREHLMTEKTEMIKRPENAKSRSSQHFAISFVFEILISNNLSVRGRSKMLLQSYATRNLLWHFNRIDFEETTSLQNLKLLGSFIRTSSNENNVYIVFEDHVRREKLVSRDNNVENSLYGDLACLLSADSEDAGCRRMVLLTAKVNIDNDKLTPKERGWHSVMLSSDPEDLLKTSL